MRMRNIRKDRKTREKFSETYLNPEDFIYPERFKGIPMFWDDVFYLSYFETIELEKYWKKLIGALKKKGYEIVPEITAKSVLE